MVYDPCECDVCDLICCGVPMVEMKEKPKKATKAKKKVAKKVQKKKVARKKAG